MKVSYLAIFDLDGTLFQTHTVTVPAVQTTFQDFNLDVPTSGEICRFFGKPAAYFHDWIRQLADSTHADKICALIDKKELSFVKRFGKLYPRIHDVLGNLQKIDTIPALCTNGTNPYVSAVLDTMNISQYFHYVRCRKEALDTKAGMTAEILQAYPSLPAVFIGDRLDDILAARANGIPVIGAGYGYACPGELRQADITIMSSEKLFDAIKTLIVRS